MTNKEAIKILERLQDPDPHEGTLTEDAYNALQMAIETLEKLKPEKKLTNGDLMDIFRERFPELHPIDFRPPSGEYAKDKKGLTIWLDNGDIILWFPKGGDEG